MVTTFFYFSLQVKRSFQKEHDILDFIGKKEALEQLINASLPSFQGTLKRGEMQVILSKYVTQIRDEIGVTQIKDEIGNGSLNAHHFTEKEEEDTQNFDTLNDFILNWNQCDLDTGTDEKAEALISLLEWTRGDTIASATLYQEKIIPGGSACDGSKPFRDSIGSLRSIFGISSGFTPQTKNYALLIGELNSPFHYEIKGVGLSKIPGNYMYARGEAILDNGEKIIQEKQKYIYSPLPYPQQFTYYAD